MSNMNLFNFKDDFFTPIKKLFSRSPWLDQLKEEDGAHHDKVVAFGTYLRDEMLGEYDRAADFLRHQEAYERLEETILPLLDHNQQRALQESFGNVVKTGGSAAAINSCISILTSFVKVGYQYGRDRAARANLKKVVDSLHVVALASSKSEMEQLAGDVAEKLQFRFKGILKKLSNSPFGGTQMLASLLVSSLFDEVKSKNFGSNEKLAYLLAKAAVPKAGSDRFMGWNKRNLRIGSVDGDDLTFAGLCVRSGAAVVESDAVTAEEGEKYNRSGKQYRHFRPGFFSSGADKSKKYGYQHFVNKDELMDALSYHSTCRNASG